MTRRQTLLGLTCALAAAAGPAATAQALPSARGSPLRTGLLDIAHRGASGLAPEHTFAAYDLALALGADVIEQDVAPTADGHLVILHDNTLDRTTDCTGRPEEKTLAELKRCDAGSWFNERYPELARPEYVGQRIPTLDEVLTRYGDSVNYYIETKIYENGGRLERGVIELLRKHRLTDAAVTDSQVFLQSFLPQHLLRMRIWEPGIPRIQLLNELLAPANAAEVAAAATFADGVGPSAGETSKALVDQAHAAGLLVHPYTVDEPEQMAALERLGVDGMFTNHPERFEARRGAHADGVGLAAGGRVRGLWRLPAGTLVDGPPAGAALKGTDIAGAPAPLAGQPVAGISAIVPAGPRRYLVAVDDQWDTPRRAADVILRLHRLRLAGSRATVAGTIVLRGADGKPLTGADYDPEALVRAADGSLWVGEERGPSLLHFSARGRLLGEPVRLDGFSTPWSVPAGVGAPGNPLAPRPVGATPPPTLLPSRGIQGLAAVARGRRLLALIAGPVTGEPDPRTRLIVELDARTARPTGRRWRFRVAAAGHVASDLVALSSRRVLVIDRDTRGGRDARHKVVLRLALDRAGADGHVPATLVLDLLALRRRTGAGRWSMPFAEIDALAVAGGNLVVANDNDLPFGSARSPGRPDDTEVTLIDPDRRLRP